MRNTGEVVWTPHTTYRSTVDFLKESVRAKSFRELFPATALLLPGSDLAIPVPPAQLEWTLEPALSAAWQAHDYVADLLLKHGQDRLSEALSGNSLRRKAFATYVRAGYDAYEKAGTIRTGSPTDVMLKGWGLATNSGQCFLDWREADRADALKKYPTVTWQDELVHMRSNVKWMSQTDNLLTALERVGKALVLVR